MSLGTQAVVLLSGGLDSATLLYRLVRSGEHPVCIFVNYGQRMALTEHRATQRLCDDLGVPLYTVDVPLPSSMTSGWLVEPPSFPEWSDHFVTHLPHRNTLLVTLGAMLATKIRASSIYLGLIDILTTPFPDCTASFLERVQSTLRLTDPNLSIIAPFLRWTKRDVAVEALRLGVPVDYTFSCSFSADHHCMECPSCLDRYDALAYAEAILRNGDANT